MKKSFPGLSIALMALIFVSCPNIDLPPTDQSVTLLAIPGVTAPVRGAAQATTVIDTAQYAGTIAWAPAASLFAASTAYTAHIELAAKSGWTLDGVAANSFTVAGATATNAANSGSVAAVFPPTGAQSDIDVTFTGASQVGGVSNSATTTSLTLTFSADPSSLAAADITVTGAAKGALTGAGLSRDLAISDITVANGATISVDVASPAGFSISGSPQTAVVYKAPTIITLFAIPGVIAPVQGAAPSTAAIDAAQYSGAIEWSGSPATFAAATVYTANIALTARPGWTFTGVAADSFTVAGAMATNAANTGIITAVFPETGNDIQATYANIAGTWRTTETYSMIESSSSTPGEEPGESIAYDCSAIVTRTIDAAGDYLDLRTVARTTVEEPKTVSSYYEAYTGIVTLSGSGNATWSEALAAGSDTPFEDPIPWSSSIAAETNTIIIIDGKLYIDSAYRRLGSGTGLIGTWIKERNRLFNEAGQYYRTTIAFTDAAMTFKDELSDDGIAYSTSGSGGFPITINADSSISTGGGKMYYLLSGDWFVFGNGTESDNEGWVKQ